jgi:cytochrome P450
MSPQPTLILLTLLATLGHAAYLYWSQLREHRQFAKAHGCQPIVPRFGVPVLLGLDTLPGLIRAIRQHRLCAYGSECFQKYGHTFDACELGRRYIATVDPENIKTILSLHFKDYAIADRLFAFGPLLGESIFDLDGEAWARSRALIRPSFARDQIADFASLELLFQDLVEALPRDGKTTVDLQGLFYSYSLDSATEFLFGRAAGTLRGEHAGSKLDDAINYAKYAIMMRGTLGRLNAVWCDRKADEAFRTCRSFGAQFVGEAIELVKRTGNEIGTVSAKRIFSHELAARTSDRKVILDEAMSLLLAGRDTTASLLGNLFFILAKNPAIWEKLRQEVASLDGRPPSYDELQHMRYVRHCVNECRSMSCYRQILANIDSSPHTPSGPAE